MAYVIAKEQASAAEEPKEPSGRGRGRPAGSTNTKKSPQDPVHKSERQSSASDAAEAEKLGKEAKSTVRKTAMVEKKGEQPKKGRGRPRKKAEVESETSGSGSGKKRGRPPGPAKVNGAKKQKT